MQDIEKNARTAQQELQDVRQLKDALDEYERKMAELLQSLHSVERSFMKQKEH